MSASLIQLKGISKQYRKNKILIDVDLRVEPGEIITLIGPNGAGKTTLVKIVLGLVHADTGSITRHPNLRIGYMPQKLHVDPTLPITLGRFLKLSNSDTTQCISALEEVGISQHMNSPLQSLSGGEMQRALLARAILRKPNFLVLDEPVQGVDVTGQEALYRLINQLRDRLPCGVLMVSHDLHLVMSSTDQVVCLNQHICCHGRPDQVSVNPAFIELFGSKTAIYTHQHDHHHDLHGEVVTPKQDSTACSHE